MTVFVLVQAEQFGRHREIEPKTHVQKRPVGHPQRSAPLHVVEEGHEAEIHMELLVAMEKREAGIVGDEIDFGLLIATEHDDVLFDASCGDTRDLCKFEAVAVEVDGVDVVALIAETDAVAAALA